MIRSSSGTDSFASHLYTAPAVTPKTSESCSCVRARSFRKLRMFSASLISIVLLLGVSEDDYMGKKQKSEQTGHINGIIFSLPAVRVWTACIRIR